jgi:protein-S-isoprenylcysteine O-methyltransferase Ste14
MRMATDRSAIPFQLLDWPPVWTAGALALTWLASWILPWGILGTLGCALGIALVLAGLAAMAAAVWEMQKARTTVIPRRQPSALVTTGIFGYSRNPIYLGDLLVVAGAMLWLQVPWALPMIGVLAWVLRTRFIEGEEQHLMTGFGAEYALWAARTARWVGRNAG